MSIHSSPFAYTSDEQAIDPAMLQLPPASSTPSPLGSYMSSSPNEAPTQPSTAPFTSPARFTSFWSPVESGNLGFVYQSPLSAFEFDHSYTETPTTGSFASPTRPAGPLRGYSASYLPNRQPSSLTSSSQSPATPYTAFSPYINPYPSPSLNRQPSASLASHGPKRVFHPSPASSTSPALGVDLTHLPVFPDFPGARQSLAPSAEPKVPRFRPTKEQLDILITAYEENKSPDALTREALAKVLGPDVRPKTLQIWFQNRRSKSRAKDRELNLPKPLDVRARTSLTGRLSSSVGPRRSVDLDALYNLVHDDNPSLLLVPITVLNISSWTRILTPMSYTSPDLGCAISFNPRPTLTLYVLHKSETFRFSIPVNENTMSDLQATMGPVHSEAVAISFELVPGVVSFASWVETDEVGYWQVAPDFTSGEAAGGGRCEITGDREVLLPAFARVHKLLEGIPPPGQTTTFPLSAQPITPFPSTWRFPTNTTTSEHFSPLHPTHPAGMGYHQRQRSFSAPNPMATAPDPHTDWSTLASPAMIIPPPNSPMSGPGGTHWTFPISALQTPAYSAGFQTFGMLQTGQPGGSAGVMTPVYMAGAHMASGDVSDEEDGDTR